MRRLLIACLVLGACKGEKKRDERSVGALRDAGMLVAKPGAPATERAPATEGAPATYETPTTDACDKALANLTQVVSGGVFGDAVDMKYCMQMPRTAVQCLAGVRTEAEADACLEGYAAAQPTRAGPPPGPPDTPLATEPHCRKAIENVKRLVPEMTADTDEMVKRCAGSEPASYVSCLVAARTTEELDLCDLRAE